MNQILRELHCSFYNLFYYFGVIWNDRDWDHAYMWILQLKKFEKAYKYRTTSKYCMRCIDQDKQDQALKVCINILKRKLDDWYTDIWHLHYDQQTFKDISNKVEERDWKIYCKLIEKYQQTWWD